MGLRRDWVSRNGCFATSRDQVLNISSGGSGIGLMATQALAANGTSFYLST